MKDNTDPVTSLLARREIANVSFQKLYPIQAVCEVFPPAGRQVIERAHMSPSLQQSIYEMRANESRRARDQNVAVPKTHCPRIREACGVLQGSSSMP
jgi:hypothetical protein